MFLLRLDSNSWITSIPDYVYLSAGQCSIVAYMCRVGVCLSHTRRRPATGGGLAYASDLGGNFGRELDWTSSEPERAEIKVDVPR